MLLVAAAAVVEIGSGRELAASYGQAGSASVGEPNAQNLSVDALPRQVRAHDRLFFCTTNAFFICQR